MSTGRWTGQVRRPVVAAGAVSGHDQSMSSSAVTVRGLQKRYRVRRGGGWARAATVTAVDGIGAAGYLLKDATRADLLHAVRAAARGETVLAPSVATRLLHRVRHPAVSLSARELEVLRLVARGLSNAEIGRQLHISEATVKTHLLRTFSKLGVSDRTAAVTTAITAGVLDPP
jgi:DNA-binding NarL/FixJ family response regulator